MHPFHYDLAMTLLSSTLAGSPDDALAVAVPGGVSLTYGDLRQNVDLCAAALASEGVGPGTRVSVVLGNDPEFLISFLAVVRAGGVAAPLNPAYTAEEFQFYLRDAGAEVAIAPPGKHAIKRAGGELNVPIVDAYMDERSLHLSRDGRKLTGWAAPANPTVESIALFLHTSGTTSRPKGVPLSHGNIATSAHNISGTYGLSPSDVAMVVMPLFHVHGLIGVALSTLSTGGTLVLPPRFSASSFWPDSQSMGATWYSAVPTIHRILLDRADDDGAPEKSFRFIRSCSAPLQPELMQGLESRFGAPVLEAYGMTEAAHQMSSNPLPPGERRLGSVGAGTGVEVSVRDESGAALGAGTRGEVCVRGPNVMTGYVDNPEANEAAFWGSWFRTGDQGILSNDGYLSLTGRLKELINRGGEKVSPVEVDEALLSHPAVAEAVAFGAPDSKYGECVFAAVVLKDEATEADLRDHCAGILASFKVPDRVHLVKGLPRTATGKVQRRHVASEILIGNRDAD